jgi:hypothetical protein
MMDGILDYYNVSRKVTQDEIKDWFSLIKMLEDIKDEQKYICGCGNDKVVQMLSRKNIFICINCNRKIKVSKKCIKRIERV